jgi:hypothetical protein
MMLDICGWRLTRLRYSPSCALFHASSSPPLSKAAASASHLSAILFASATGMTIAVGFDDDAIGDSVGWWWMTVVVDGGGGGW